MLVASKVMSAFAQDVGFANSWFCQHPSTPASGTRSFRFANVSFQWCILGNWFGKFFFNLSVVSILDRNSQACLKPYEDNTQLNNTLQILLFINLDQQPTVSAILAAVILHSDLRMDPLKIIGTPWMNLIPRLETVIRVTKKKENLPWGALVEKKGPTVEVSPSNLHPWIFGTWTWRFSTGFDSLCRMSFLVEEKWCSSWNFETMAMAVSLLHRWDDFNDGFYFLIFAKDIATDTNIPQGYTQAVSFFPALPAARMGYFTVRWYGRFNRGWSLGWSWCLFDVKRPKDKDSFNTSFCIYSTRDINIRRYSSRYRCRYRYRYRYG